MSSFSIWQFIRQNAELAVLAITGFLALGIFFLRSRLMHRNVRKQKRQGLAACWFATLSELSQALDRMQESTHHLIRDHQGPFRPETAHKSDISTHRWVREGFLLMAGDQAGASLVESLNVDCDFFGWNVNQTTNARAHMLGSSGATQAERDILQDTIDEFDAATISFACNHHHGMVRDWKTSAAFLETYCSEHELDRGIGLSVPSEFPLKWQRDDAKPWAIENLAHVGEDKWEP